MTPEKLKKIKQFLEEKVGEERTRVIVRIYESIQSIGCGKNLNKLALVYRTDKNLSHHYTQHYMTHLKSYKYKKINLLEIGVGGYENPKLGGQSLRMWKRYFPFAKIFAIDIYDKSALQEKRIKIFQGSQVDELFLNKVIDTIGELDVIIDDGSHVNEHVIETFNILFPKLKIGGVYIVEDTQTAYWEDYGGTSEDLHNSPTSLNYFKSLTDCINNVEFIKPGYQQTYFDKHIVSMHFYHNMVFIHKGVNDEESNLVKNNQINQ